MPRRWRPKRRRPLVACRDENDDARNHDAGNDDAGADDAGNHDAARDLPTQPLDPRLVRAREARTRYLEAHGSDAARAIAALKDDMRAVARRINVIGRAHSMFDLLDYVRFAETAVDSNSYRESSHQGSALVVELVAASLAAPPHTAPEDAQSAATKTPLADAAQGVLGLGHELFDLVTARGLLIAEDEGFDPTMPGNVAVQRELFVRGTTYAHIIEHLLTELFAKSEMEALCRRLFGFSGSEACKLLVAVRQRCDASVAETYQRMERLRDSRRSMAEAAMSATRSAGHDDPQRHLAQALRHEAIDRIFFPVPVASTFSAHELAEATGITTATVERVLSAFCYSTTERDAGRAVEQAVRGPSPFRAAPILCDGDRYFMTHCSFGLHVVREAVESWLRGSPNWQPYQDCRGRFLEDEALKLLARMLPSAKVHGGVEYFAPNPKTAEANGPPEHYTQECEADGLLIVDDIALIMEAKAGNLRIQSRSGDGPALKKDLENLIWKASFQAKRLHDLIVRDRCVRLVDESWLDMSAVREVHAIAVSLEDLSGFATAAAGLLKEQIISTDFVPWMVSLHDLHVISEIVQHGAEMIVYVRRRTNPDIVGTCFAYDELDYFMAFLGGGLRADREPHQAVFAGTTGAVPRAGSGSASREQPRKFLSSHTESLDDWYRCKHGNRTIAASRPELETEPAIRAVVDALATQQAPDWVSMSTALLGHDLLAQKHLVNCITTALDQTRADGRSRTVCAVGGDPASETNTLILSTMAEGDDIQAAAERLAGYVTAKKHQEQTAIGVGLLFRTQDSGIPSVSCYDNRQPASNPALDALVAAYGLVPNSEAST